MCVCVCVWLVGFYGIPTHWVILCRKRFYLLFLFSIIFMRIVICISFYFDVVGICL